MIACRKSGKRREAGEGFPSITESMEQPHGSTKPGRKAMLSHCSIEETSQRLCSKDKARGGRLKTSLARLHKSEPRLLSPQKSVRSFKSVRSTQSMNIEKELLLSSLSSLSGIVHGNTRENVLAGRESLLNSMSSLNELLEEEDEIDPEKDNFDALMTSVQSFVSHDERFEPERIVDKALHESFRTQSESTEDSTIHGSLAEVADAVGALLLSRHTFTVQEESSLEIELRSLKKMRKSAFPEFTSPTSSGQLPLIPENPDPSVDADEGKKSNKGLLDAYLSGEATRKKAIDYQKQKEKVVTIVTSSRQSMTHLAQPKTSSRQSMTHHTQPKSMKVTRREHYKEDLSPITLESFNSSASSFSSIIAQGIKLPYAEKTTLESHFQRNDTAPKKPSRSRD